MTDWLGMRWHSKWNYVYAYSARGEVWRADALGSAPDLEGWSPDLADWADAWACACEDDEHQALYEAQMAEYQAQMEAEWRRLEEARLADLDRQTAPWGQRWY